MNARLLLLPLLTVSLNTASASSESPVTASKSNREFLGKALKILNEAKSHEDSDVRRLVAQEWGEIGNPAAKKTLHRLLEDPNSYVRIAAAKSLYRMGDKSGIKALLRIINQRPKTLQNEGLLNAVEELKEIAHDKVRVAAIKALSQAESTATIKVMKWAQKDPRGAIRDAAAIVLAQLGQDQEIERFVEALDSEDENERLAAVWSLGEIATPAVIEPLRTKFNDPSYHVRAAVLQALGSADDFDSLPNLQAGTRDGNDLVRAKAVEALSRLRSREAIPALRYVVEKSTNAYIQLLAMSGLAKMKTPVDLQLAQRCLAQPDFDTRMLAVEVLGVAGGRQALEMLEFALDDSQMKVRVAASAAIIKLSQKKERNP